MRIQITRSQYAIRKQTEAEEIYKKLIIRIANKRRSKATIIQSSSDEKEDPITIKFSDDKVQGVTEETKIEIEIKKTQISTSERPQRSASARKLPQRLKD